MSPNRMLLLALSVVALLISMPLPVQSSVGSQCSAAAVPIDLEFEEIDRQVPMAQCIAEITCPDGTEISCGGNLGTCSSGTTWVECDGRRTDCPAAGGCTFTPRPLLCDDAFCDSKCTYDGFCDESQGCCVCGIF